MDYSYSGEFLSDFSVISLKIEKIIKDLSDILCEECLLETRLIINELLINAILHGNRSMRQRLVRFSIAVDKGVIEIKVADEGGGINRRRESSGVLLCTGRGLTLVENLSEELFINKNQVRVLKIL